MFDDEVKKGGIEPDLNTKFLILLFCVHDQARDKTIVRLGILWENHAAKPILAQSVVLLA